MTQLAEITRHYLRHYGEIYQDDFYVNQRECLYKILAGTLPEPAPAPVNEKTDVSLNDTIKMCQLCSLSQSRRHAVPGTGNPDASLMIIGSSPSQDDDLKGLPFTAENGKLLDNILKAIDFNRGEIYLTQVVKCKPPLHRDPEPDEIKACSVYLRKQIMKIGPKLILALGRVAGETLIRSQHSVAKMRGQVHQYQGIPVFVTYGLDGLANNIPLKKEVWKDVQQLRRYYDSQAGDKPVWQPKKK